MRLPHPCTPNIGFMVDSASDLIKLLGSECTTEEAELISRYWESGLPPITSVNSLSVMFGYNPGFIWSLLKKTRRHYRFFDISKGSGTRMISAPKVALKSIQQWLGHHFNEKYLAPETVFGFVKGRSHLDAAECHLKAEWVASVDVENFFPSVSTWHVQSALKDLGYADDFSVRAITALTCIGGGLAQGSPASPVIANLALANLDQKLLAEATSHNCTFTRYADDIVFSGRGECPTEVLERITAIVLSEGWRASTRKSRISKSPARLKVHGLLVHGDEIRLTKGYRNRLRAYRHLASKQEIKQSDIAKINGHLEFARSVECRKNNRR